MTTPRVSVSVAEQPDATFRASALLPSGTTVDVVRKDREEAVRECANTCHRLAAVQGQAIATVLPFCHPQWAAAYWELPAFRRYDPDAVDPEGEKPAPVSAQRESDDGPVAIPLDELTGETP